ncbi:XAC2610-related protein [Flavobacterium sp.]|uniref:XAC2610-related protein n=1 Tax=Flavobacterium sp. TaxID=239 RepID=UPI0039E5F6E0
MKTIIIILFFTNIIFAQHKFSIENGSKIYSAEILIDTCDQQNCQGLGVIKLIDKVSKRLVQEFTSEDLYFFLDERNKPTVNIIQLYDEQSPLIFDDFNFDGTEDLAIRDGNHSGYGGPSYSVYVYNITKKEFVYSLELSELADAPNLGMFEVDHERKRIKTFSKSGCCFHTTLEYEVVPRKGLVNVYELEEDAQGGEHVIVTEKKLIKGKWQVKKKKHKLDDYYKQ